MESHARGLGVRQGWRLVSISRRKALNLNLYAKLPLEKAEE